MSVIRRDHVSLEETKESLKKLTSILGRNPFQHECQPLSKKHGLRVYKRISRYYSKVGATDFYSFLEKLGFENVVKPHPSEYLHDQIIKSLDPDRVKEVPIKRGSTYVRCDYSIQYKGHTLYLEIDGSSHASPLSRYHRFKEDPEAAFRKTLSRDAFIQEWCEQQGVILVRLNYHHLLSLKKSDLVSILDSAVQGRVVNSLRDRNLALQKLKRLLDEGKTIKECSKELGFGSSTLYSWLKRNNHKNPYLKRQLERSMELKNSIQLLLKAGHSKPFVAKKLGVSQQTVFNYKKKLSKESQNVV